MRVFDELCRGLRRTIATDDAAGVRGPQRSCCLAHASAPKAEEAGYCRCRCSCSQPHACGVCVSAAAGPCGPTPAGAAAETPFPSGRRTGISRHRVRLWGRTRAGGRRPRLGATRFNGFLGTRLLWLVFPLRGAATGHWGDLEGVL